MILYPPNKGEPIDVHPTRIELMKSRGWTEQPKTTKKKEAK